MASIMSELLIKDLYHFSVKPRSGNVSDLLSLKLNTTRTTTGTYKNNNAAIASVDNVPDVILSFILADNLIVGSTQIQTTGSFKFI